MPGSVCVRKATGVQLGGVGRSRIQQPGAEASRSPAKEGVSAVGTTGTIPAAWLNTGCLVHSGDHVCPPASATGDFLGDRGCFAPTQEFPRERRYLQGLGNSAPCSSRDGLIPKQTELHLGAGQREMLQFRPEQSAQGKSRDKMHRVFMQHPQKNQFC